MDFTGRIEKKYMEICENKDIARYLYFAGLGIYMLFALYDTTMYPDVGKLGLVIEVISVSLVALKMVLSDHFHMSEFFLISGIVISGMLCYVVGKYIIVFLFLWIIVGSKGIPFREILSVYVILCGAVLMLSFSGAGLSIIESVEVTDRGRELFGIRLKSANSFGIKNTTDFAAHIFFLYLSVFYLVGEKNKAVFSLFGFVLSFFLYYKTQGRIDSGCLLILSGLCILDRIIDAKKSVRLKEKWKKCWNIAGFISMPLAAAVSFAFCIMYHPSSVWNKVNKFSSSRISDGKRYFDTFPVNLFGRAVELVGQGGTGRVEMMSGKEYLFFDISYQMLLLRYGLLIFLIVVVAYMVIARKYKDDTNMMFCITLISLNCMFAHHLLEIAYIPFILALFAEKSDSRTYMDKGSS